MDRNFVIALLDESINISESLAHHSISKINSLKISQVSYAKILIGLDIRKNLFSIKLLSEYNLDDQVLIVFRNIFENVVTMEYLSNTTKRKNKTLDTKKKAFLFITYPIFKNGDFDTNFKNSKEYIKLSKKRNSIVSNHKYWHGSNLRSICEEIDKTFNRNKSPFVESYDNLYRDLSFVSHPNSREKFHLIYDENTNSVTLKEKYNEPINILFSTLWAMRAVRRWAVATKYLEKEHINKFIKKLINYIKSK